MPLDLETILSLHTMRRMERQTNLLLEEDLLEEKEEDMCPGCGGPMFEDEGEAFALYCPVCDRRFR